MWITVPIPDYKDYSTNSAVEFFTNRVLLILIFIIIIFLGLNAKWLYKWIFSHLSLLRYFKPGTSLEEFFYVQVSTQYLPVQKYIIITFAIVTYE